MSSLNNKTAYFADGKSIIPILVTNEIEQAREMCKALVDTNVKYLELTLRTPNAMSILETVCNEFPDLIIGAGTVNTVSQYKEAIDKGAKFVISPGVSRALLDEYIKTPCLYIPGVITPSEILMAKEYGLDHLKFFPASAFGGTHTLKSLSGPFADVKFCPTGGITMGNIREFIDLPSVFAVGCTYLCEKSLLDNKQYDKIRENISHTKDIINNK